MLRSEMEIKEASYKQQFEILQASQVELKHSNTLIKTELAAAQQSNISSSSNIPAKIEVPQDLVGQEQLQRVETECEQLRERVRVMMQGEERLKVTVQQSEFAKIRAEEEAKRLRDESVQRAVKIRYLEEISEENGRLQAQVSQL